MLFPQVRGRLMARRQPLELVIKVRVLAPQFDTDGRFGRRVAIAAYLGPGARFDQALLAFADAYATQNERDYARLVGAVQSGEIIARTGL